MTEIDYKTEMTPSKSLGQETLIQMRNVSKVYEVGKVEVQALRDVELEIASGEFVVVLGPSGSGKTTLLNMIGGIDTPTEGSVIVAGMNISDFDEKQLTEYRRHRIGFVFQFFNLIPSLTAKENVELAADLVTNPLHLDDLLMRVGLVDRADHFPSELSGGEQQRVAIARALVKDPLVLLADEPTGELDFETGVQILSLIWELSHKAGKTIVLVTHNTLVGSIASRVVQMRSGKIWDIQVNSSPVHPGELRW